MSEPVRVLILCTGNSARSQMAEALFSTMGKGRIVAESAGSSPAARVNPLAISTLAESGIDWRGHPPRGLDGLVERPWDFVITVCDNAREACPVFPKRTATAHWSTPDPTDAAGFRDAFRLLRRRVDLMLALPLEKLEHAAREAKVRAVGLER